MKGFTVRLKSVISAVLLGGALAVVMFVIVLVPVLISLRLMKRKD